MDDETKDAEQEVRRLQRCMIDLVGVLALPAMWSGSEPRRILETFLDALVEMLDLDFLYGTISPDSGSTPVEVVRIARSSVIEQSPEEIHRTLYEWYGRDPHRWPPERRRNFGGQEISTLPLSLGIGGDLGLVVAGTRRASFPVDTERLILSVAANQAAIGLQQARRLSEERQLARDLDRRVAERTRELAETNAELQLQVGLLQHLPVSAWTLQPDGTPDFVNQVWLEFSGQTSDFVRSHPEAWMTAVHPDDRERAARIFREGVRAGEGFALETRSLRAQDGTYRWHLQQAVALRDGEGKVVRFVGTTTDIDDQKRADEELNRSEAKYRVVVETASDAVISIDESGAIILANPATKRIFGHAPEDLIGRPITVLMPLGMRAIHEAGYRRYLETGVRHIEWQGTEVTAMRADGAEFPAEVSFGEMTSNKRRIFTGFIRDISEKKNAEEALGKVQSELAHVSRVTSMGAFTASMAHEINQPLSGIITNASTCLRMLDAVPPNVNGARETARRALRDGNRVSDVITRLRTLFTGKAVEAAPVDINEIAREVLAVYLVELQRNRVTLRQEFSDGLPRVMGDRVQLQQVILNLVRNATDAMREVDDRSRELLLRTEPAGGEIVFKVRDAGTGINPATAEQLFNSFYTTKEDGMGIGLSLSRSIIEAHNGRLWVMANEGPGATFAFSVPCA